MRILIVEDEKGIANFVRDGLKEEGFAVDVAVNGNVGWEYFSSNDYDCILLDWMLPGMSGIELCSRIRKKNSSIPIIFLTAKDTPTDTVFGLESGANDYIKKPFDFSELLARIRVQLRPKDVDGTVLECRDITLNRDTRQVFQSKNEIGLTAKEFSLLEFLLQNKGKVCSRTKIIEHVWDIHFDADTSVIDVYVNYLRKKLDPSGKKKYIETIRGAGYVIREK